MPNTVKVHNKRLSISCKVNIKLHKPRIFKRHSNSKGINKSSISIQPNVLKIHKTTKPTSNHKIPRNGSPNISTLRGRQTTRFW